MQKQDFIKNVEYRLLYQCNLMRYRKKKVRIPFLEVWVGQSCNLQCINCCHLIPYLEPKLYDIKQIIKDCQRILQCCEVEFFSIVGGEPFCHPQLNRFIDFVARCPDIHKGKIVTNGTILPKENTIESLKELRGKLEVRIDGYPGIGIGTAETFADLMKENQIPYHFTRFRPDKPSSWKQLTPNGNKPLRKTQVKQRFSKCGIRDCNTLADGQFTLCPRGIGSEAVFHVHKNKYENVNIRELISRPAMKARIATCMDVSVSKNFCKYCLSLSDKNNNYVKPGEQT